MNLRINVATTRNVAARWMDHYFRNGKWTDTAYAPGKEIYDRLLALGPNPEPDAVAGVIGNKSWSYISCECCGDYVARAVSLGDSGVNVCRHCLAAATAALEVST